MSAPATRRRPLVGRDEEVELLEAVLSRRQPSGLRVLEIRGDPGIGKTSLLHEVVTRASRRGETVATARAGELGPELPFGVLREALLLPSSSEVSNRYQVWDAVRQAVEERAAGGRLVLCLDDVHWLDSGSCEVVAQLLRRGTDAPVLLVLAYRPRQLPPVVASALADVTDRTVLTVGPLLEGAAAALVATVDGTGRAELHALSRGNPLYLITLAAKGVSGSDESPTSPAEALTRSVSTELRAAGTQARAVALAAAVLGEPIRPGHVAAVSGAAEGAVVEALDRLADRDIVREEPGRGLVFRHPLVASAVYADAGPAWRQQAHARAAAALSEAGAPLAVVAHHLCRAGVAAGENAADILERAAAALLWQAPGCAAEWVEVALSTVPEQDDARRQRLTVAFAEALAVAGRLATARERLHAVLPELTAGSELRERAVALAASTDHLLGRHDEAAALLHRELRERAVEPEPVGRRLVVELAAAYLMQGRWDDGRHWAEQLLTSPDRLEPALEATAVAMVSLTRYTAGDVEAAEHAADEAARLVDGLADAELATSLGAAMWLGWTESFLGRYPAALRHQTRAADLARRCGLSHLLTHLLVGQGSTHKWRGELPQALRCFEEAREVALVTGSESLLTMALTMLCRAHTWLGNHDEAERLGTQAVGSTGLREDWFAALAPVVLAQARLEFGDPRGCQDAVLDAGGGADLRRLDPFSRPDWYHLLTRAALASDDVPAARDWAERAWRCGGAAGHRLPSAVGFALLAEAEVSLSLRDAVRAAECAGRAAGLLSRAGNVLDSARAQLVRGRALTMAGERRRAVDVLAAAEQTFRDCSAAALRDQAARDLRQLGRRVAVRRAKTGATAAGALTQREAEVAELVTRGLTNREIAASLFLSEKTVERHVGHILLKLGVSRRSAVAAHWASQALVAV